MYGVLNSFEDDTLFVHNMLEKFQLKEDGVSLKEKLNKQIVVTKNEDEEEDLSNDESILKFINKHSKYGKIVRELEFFQETLSHKIYKIVGSEEEIVIKV